MSAGFFCANFGRGRAGLMIEYIWIFCKKLSVVTFMTITFKYIFGDSFDLERKTEAEAIWKKR